MMAVQQDILLPPHVQGSVACSLGCDALFQFCKLLRQQGRQQAFKLVVNAKAGDVGYVGGNLRTAGNARRHNFHLVSLNMVRPRSPLVRGAQVPVKKASSLRWYRAMSPSSSFMLLSYGTWQASEACPQTRAHDLALDLGGSTARAA